MLYTLFSGYFEEINENKYLELISTNESKEKKEKNMKICGIKSQI